MTVPQNIDVETGEIKPVKLDTAGTRFFEVYMAWVQLPDEVKLKMARDMQLFAELVSTFQRVMIEQQNK